MGTSRTPAWFRRLLRHEKVRFAAVGALNTVTDFTVFFVLANLVFLPAIVANSLSTTAALGLSYFLNKKAVFGNTDTTKSKQVLLFVAVTLTGLWMLQGGIIMVLAPVLQPLVGQPMSLLGAKLIATLASLTWNYLWYSRVIFRKKPA